jgi:adenylate cyclase
VRHAAVLFVDIRGFTSLSEAMRPDEVVRLLNFYFDRLGRVIVTEQRILNKYIGDAMMAVFGAPVPLPNPAATALRAAVRMRDAVDGLTQEQARGGLACVADPLAFIAARCSRAISARPSAWNTPSLAIR